MSSGRYRLATENTQALQRLADLRGDFDAMVAASRDTNADDEHDPEGATIAFERSQVEALVRQAQHHLEEIDAAIKSLEAGRELHRVCRVQPRLRGGCPVAGYADRPVSAFVAVVVALLTGGYMLPWAVAALRGKSNHWTIFWINLLGAGP